MYALTLNLLVVKLPGLGVITFTPTGLMIALVIIGTIFILLRRQYLREGKNEGKKTKNLTKRILTSGQQKKY